MGIYGLQGLINYVYKGLDLSELLRLLINAILDSLQAKSKEGFYSEFIVSYLSIYYFYIGFKG